MVHRAAADDLATHSVVNQPPDYAPRDLWAGDAALREAVLRHGGAGAGDLPAALGALAGSARVMELGELANRHPPTLRAFDRYGRRVDEVEFHPAYHELMDLVARHHVQSIAWMPERPGGHVAHAAMVILLTQAEAGVLCPAAMSYASVPVLRRRPDLAAEWLPRLLSGRYDGRCIPAGEKAGATIGMAMTEKQGGSDVRANSTRARPAGGGNGGGEGGEYLLTGHKWFCSAPMSDAFLTLAQTDRGLSCFLVPRWRPDGTRNVFRIQRLKDKLGNRSNASAEIEYDGTSAWLVGGEGAGTATIMDMVHHTRLDCGAAAAGLMRAAVGRALHHTGHRSAFGRRLIDQPLMRQVLADMALESEAATALVLRVARAFDRASADPASRAFARLGVAVCKYWVTKRCPTLVYEALECHGGNGYVEEGDMPRLYREAPLNAIWEGSGNVICLDVLRTLQREPAALAALEAELAAAGGLDGRLDRWMADTRALLAAGTSLDLQARRLVERLALALQAAELLRHGPPAVADAFCASRLGGDWGQAFGTLPAGVDSEAILARAAG
ncbi:acyl-CoA dehydrogenase family protein [Azospirillum picis]|uniref:Acyl-CoA dehydrogenase n=1 Tax=Azospirillum picis TaxID=488438 RepID=A0ABU0MUX2_9PROT|nr:acyl-CoA dehydrogenase family protein [Azospirillum picis]MBP2303397.1 putative acyl-CoA dehydrogenase [Azospirillum picis]MDQ0537277.1 putative acyl-CoA dehydrogenase [Azospirillum picis]